ncbi:MAG: riboflavin synthase [Candidatus Omnitrophica bacterium]|nr:riboflavin synthase [Candidatus Omnitrophota bacterium]
MFSGIIERLVIVEKLERTSRGVRFAIAYKNEVAPVQEGESIAINGVCLTAAAMEEGRFWVEAVKETLEATTLSSVKTHDRVNLERSLKVGDKISGHFVLGHVDGVAVIQKVNRNAETHDLTLKVPEICEPFMVAKGSIAVDGISLTIQAVQGKTCSVAVIPHTAAMTTLGFRKEGDRVNLETDVLAKYVQLRSNPEQPFPFTVDSLRELGF